MSENSFRTTGDYRLGDSLIIINEIGEVIYPSPIDYIQHIVIISSYISECIAPSNTSHGVMKTGLLSFSLVIYAPSIPAG